MKRLHILTLTLILSLVAVSALASDYVSTPPPSSFRGLDWGTSLADIPDLVPVAKAGYGNTFFRPEESLKFGEAEILSVAYYFRDKKLYRVGIAFKGRVNQFFLKDMLLQKYGPGRGVGFRYGWMWPDFSIDLSFDNDKKQGALFYTYEGSLKEPQPTEKP
ncbi:hypothetical protein GO013_01565 [Pseudodesulfovibrio sp. JC047]|uniref:hypothetical protein n=1 Tax=Pseudodesulfovibrio sp. JC047 TaxID=2683199 RepID=UPI0013D7AC50|nr:hypothetical protein [Pseudodesulfovibrio sp. JC047]NDV18105.1 hypothetical protein [Pseudodesulfovibrio sp. JC047]